MDFVDLSDAPCQYQGPRDDKELVGGEAGVSRSQEFLVSTTVSGASVEGGWSSVNSL